MRYRGALFMSVLAGLLSLTFQAGGARAATIPVPQVTGYLQMVVDQADGYIFISEGANSDSLLSEPNVTDPLIVTNLAGKYVTTLFAGDGVEGIALDGDTLYAALVAKDAVAAVNTTTITQPTPTQTLYPLGAGDVPYSLAVQSGKVWVSYDTGTGAGQATIGDVDLTATTPAFEPNSAQGSWYDAPYLAADPADNGALVAITEGLNPTSAATYNTTTDPATELGTTSTLGGTATSCGGVDQAAVLPGGTEFGTFCGNPGKLTKFTMTNLTTPVRRYTAGPAQFTLAITAAGTAAIGGNIPVNTNQGLEEEPEIIIRGADGAVLNVFPLTYALTLDDRGLAWSADGSMLYAMFINYNGGQGIPTFDLMTFDEPTLTQAAISLSGPSTVEITRTVELTGKLTLSTGAAVPAGSKVTVTRTGAGSATKTFAEAVNSNGTFEVTDPAATAGAFTYTVSYPGTATIAPTSAARTVTVVRIPTSLTLTTGATTFTYEPAVSVTAHLGTTYKNRTVAIYAQWIGSKSKTLLRTGRVNSRGDLTVVYRAPHSTTFSAVFSGDARYAPKTSARPVYVRARVSESLTGNYSSTYIGGVRYLLYYRSSTPVATVGVAPDKPGECVEFDIEEYYNGAWNGATTACITLNRSSRVSASFNISKADINAPYRIRADYIRNASDTTNESADSPWVYLEVE